MTCANMTREELIAVPAPTRVRFRWPAFMQAKQTMLAFQEALEEAFEMRRAAHQRRPFYDE